MNIVNIVQRHFDTALALHLHTSKRAVMTFLNPVCPLDLARDTCVDLAQKTNKQTRKQNNKTYKSISIDWHPLKWYHVS